VPSPLPPAPAPKAKAKPRAKPRAKAKAAIPKPILPIKEEAKGTETYPKKVIQKTKVTLNAEKLAGGVGKDPDKTLPAKPRGRPRKVPSAGPPSGKKVVIRKVTIASQAGGGPSVKRLGRPPGSLGKAKRDVMVHQNLLEELGF